MEGGDGIRTHYDLLQGAPKSWLSSDHLESTAFCISVAYIHLKPSLGCRNTDLTLLVITDPELIKYLNNVVEQRKGFS
ncbi:Mitotic Spindle Assembly Checkpoint Protein Mad2A [Manis pentadactyla]|nr:Mitotic Spindle Assembly Checkpoint Protein Mad2A [Manis pentadactyla]